MELPDFPTVKNTLKLVTHNVNYVSFMRLKRGCPGKAARNGTVMSDNMKSLIRVKIVFAGHTKKNRPIEHF
jgi:hypothetical protein